MYYNEISVQIQFINGLFLKSDFFIFSLKRNYREVLIIIFVTKNFNNGFKIDNKLNCKEHVSVISRKLFRFFVLEQIIQYYPHGNNRSTYIPFLCSIYLVLHSDSANLK